MSKRYKFYYEIICISSFGLILRLRFVTDSSPVLRNRSEVLSEVRTRQTRSDEDGDVISALFSPLSLAKTRLFGQSKFAIHSELASSVGAVSNFGFSVSGYKKAARPASSNHSRGQRHRLHISANRANPQQETRCRRRPSPSRKRTPPPASAT